LRALAAGQLSNRLNQCSNVILDYIGAATALGIMLSNSNLLLRGAEHRRPGWFSHNWNFLCRFVAFAKESDRIFRSSSGSEPCYAVRRKMSAIYELRPRPDGRGYNLTSDSLPFGILWYQDREFAISYAKFYSQLTGCEVRIFNAKGELLETRTADAAPRKNLD
jgi:hypothetical protein